MKRTLSSLIALGLVAALVVGFTSIASAQEKPAGKSRGAQFIDKDGDGVCDNVGTKTGQKNGQGMHKGKGPGNGTGNNGVGPKDGTGYGAKSGNGTGTGTGTCDGTGPKGARNGRGK